MLVSCRRSLYKSFSFSHPSLSFNNAGLQVRVHTCHFALHVAGWVGPLTHHHPLSCGLHHTLQAVISTCHFQPHVAGCITAPLLHCPLMLRVGCCHPHLLHCWVCCWHPLYCSGCVTATLISCIMGKLLPSPHSHSQGVLLPPFLALGCTQSCTPIYCQRLCSPLYHYEIMNYKVTKLLTQSNTTY